MQMGTRHLCLSGTHLGPAAERSRIFCINAVAVADRHLMEIMWRLGVCGLWYSTAACWSAWSQGSEKRSQMLCARSWDHLFWKKKGYTTPLFSINKDDGARWPRLRKKVQRQWDLLQPTHPEYQIVQLFWAAEVMFCQTFSETGCTSGVFFCVCPDF